jgi:F0F1-type ATP synthase assembly protein I
VPPSSKPLGSLTWLGKYLSLGLTLPASVAAGYLVGAAADHYLHHPILRVVGIFLGMASGLTQILREVLRDERSEESSRAHSKQEDPGRTGTTP